MVFMTRFGGRWANTGTEECGLDLFLCHTAFAWTAGWTDLNGSDLEPNQTPRGWAAARDISSRLCCSNHTGLVSPEFLRMQESFMFQGCLWSFISRECDAFLSTFSKWQNPTHPSKPAEVPCPLRSILRAFPTAISGRHFWLLLCISVVLYILVFYYY